MTTPVTTSAAAKAQGFSDQASYEAWFKRQWVELDAAATAQAAAYAARQAVMVAEAGRVRAVSAFWVAVEREARRQQRAAKSVEKQQESMT